MIAVNQRKQCHRTRNSWWYWNSTSPPNEIERLIRINKKKKLMKSYPSDSIKTRQSNPSFFVSRGIDAANECTPNDKSFFLKSPFPQTKVLVLDFSLRCRQTKDLLYASIFPPPWRVVQKWKIFILFLSISPSLSRHFNGNILSFFVRHFTTMNRSSFN